MATRNTSATKTVNNKTANAKTATTKANKANNENVKMKPVTSKPVAKTTKAAVKTAATKSTATSKTPTTKPVKTEPVIVNAKAETPAPAPTPIAKAKANDKIVPAVPVVAPAALPAPGAALAAKLAESGMTEGKLAKALGVALRRIREIISGERRLTADTAVRLAVYYGGDAMYWMGLQAAHEVEAERRELAEALAAIVPHGKGSKKAALVAEAA
jgi:addiction module HigA family antidote